MVTEFPLSKNINQTYTVTVSGDSRNITFIVEQFYNNIAGYWIINIYDKSKQPVVMDIPLLAGQNLLEQYGYLNIGELYVINIGDQSISKPDDTNIADNFKLVWVLE